MTEHEQRDQRWWRRGARRVGEEVAEQVLQEVAWRVLTAPFRLLARGLVHVVDLSP